MIHFSLSVMLSRVVAFTLVFVFVRYVSSSSVSSSSAVFPVSLAAPEETKGWFRQGQFWRMCSRSGFGTGEHPHVPSFRFLVPGNIRMYPRSGFATGAHPPKPPFLETTLLRTPELLLLSSPLALLSPLFLTPFPAVLPPSSVLPSLVFFFLLLTLPSDAPSSSLGRLSVKV